MTETAREAVARAIAESDGIPWRNSKERRQRRLVEEADAAIAAHLAWLDAHGWQIVPKEPTPEMVAAAERNIFEHMPDAQDWTLTYATDALRDGIAAAPKPPGE